MARIIAKKHQDQLERIKGNVENSHKYFQSNVERYHTCRKFVFESTLSSADKSTLQQLQKPTLEFNVLEAYISRLRGEFAKQEPSISVRSINADSDSVTIEVVEGIMRSILFDANNDQFEQEVYTEILTGGYSVMKVWTIYEHEDSFDQVIRIGKAYDPTLTGFDPLARSPHKGDGKYCYELYPKTREEFKEEYPHVNIDSLSFTKTMDNFNWSYTDKYNQILLMCDYYELKKFSYKLYKLSNGQTMTQSDYEKVLEAYEFRVEQPPAIVQTRNSYEYRVVRYRLVGTTVIDYVETDFKYLPLIFVDGNSADIKGQQITRPYIYNAMDAQRLKNFVGQSFANEVENMLQHKFMVEARSIPTEQLEAWLEPQKASTLLYDSTDVHGNPLPPPITVTRQPIPPELYGSFQASDSAIQNILGSYDASLGINNNQLSGVAIQEGATQSNSAAMPYVTNFLSALNQVAQTILDLIPKYYITPRTIPIVKKDGSREYVRINDTQGPDPVNLMYPRNTLEVRVKAGVNFEVQKNRAVTTMTSLMQASDGFRAMMESGGLPILVENLDIRGSDQLKTLAENFTKEQQAQQQAQQAQAGQQNNPEMMDLQLRQQKQLLEQQKLDMDARYKQASLMVEEQKLEIEKNKNQIDLITSHNQNMVQMDKAKTERESKLADLAMTKMDQDHAHTMDYIDRIPTGE